MEGLAELGRGRLMVDLGFRDTEGLVASYLLPAPEGWVVVETGPTTCLSQLAEGLQLGGIAPEEVRDVFVTHIHLDHAGGLGAVAEFLPNARLHAHRSGIPHLADPTRLIASARRAWGQAADPLWGPIRPVPAERLHALDGGERFPLQGGELEVLATPGHARHHLAYVDHPLKAVLIGDAAGVHLEGTEAARPSVPAPDLDLDLLFSSLERIRATDPRTLLYAHFGPRPASTRVFDEYRRAVERWRDVALRAAREQRDVSHVARALRTAEEATSPPARSELPAGDRPALVSSYELSAQGLLRYFDTHGLLPPERP
jgi:glyoxylase-like metal-dependent hydrolase (beta-lactamase superfamily II)